MLRSVFFHACFIPATILFGVAAQCCMKLGLQRFRPHIQYVWGKAGIVGAQVRVQTDLAHLPPPGPKIIMANHQSQLDICLFFTQLRNHDCCFVAKKPLFKIPFLGPAMKALGHVCVDQENPRQAMKAIEEAVAKAQAGQTVVIFPEGTRAFSFETLQEFQTGAMIMALKSGLPVVPVLIHGAGDVSRRETMVVNPPPRGEDGPLPLRLTALPPMRPSDAYTLKEREALRKDLQTLMTDAYERIRAESGWDRATPPPATPNPTRENDT